MSGYLPERGQQPAPGIRPAPVPRTSLPTKPPPRPHGSGACACLFCWNEIATLTAELAAERALVSQLHHAISVSAVRLSYPEVFDALAAYREARRLSGGPS